MTVRLIDDSGATHSTALFDNENGAMLSALFRVQNGDRITWDKRRGCVNGVPE